MKKTLLAIVASGLLIIAACSKNNDDTQPATTLQDILQVDLKQASAATNVMIDLHKNTANGHSLCFAQEKIYHNCDSLFSSHYYQYNQNIYSMHTGNYQVYQWSGNMWVMEMVCVDSIQFITRIIRIPHIIIIILIV